MNRSQLLVGAATGALAACAGRNRNGILLPSGESLSKGRPSSPLTAGDYSWKAADGGRWDLQMDWKDPHYQIYYTYPKDSKYPGQMTLCGDFGYANGDVYCLGYLDYSPPPPPSFHDWHLQWSPDDWKPGTIKRLFNGHLLKVFKNRVVLYTEHGDLVSQWFYDHVHAHHENYRPNRFTAVYPFDPQKVTKHAGVRPDGDCSWAVVGFLGATISTMVLVWTAETGVGAIAAAGAFMAMLKEGHEVLVCGR